MNFEIQRVVGITDDEVESVLNAVDFIKGEAAHYAGQLVKLEEKYDELQRAPHDKKRQQTGSRSS